eukprot:scaffold1342_cov255-Chaetoceros_neogracile.AAC.2
MSSLQSGLSIAAVIIGVPLGSAIGTWLLSLFVDKFCSTKMDTAIIRMIEEMNQGRPRQIPTILKGLDEEERLRVLERVLNSKVSADCQVRNEDQLPISAEFRGAHVTVVPYSQELGAQVKLEFEKSEENDRMMKMESALLKKSLTKETETFQDGQEEKSNTDASDDDENPDDMNILQRVWKEFGDKGNGNGNKDGKKTKDEVSETCAICMEDYELDQDVIIGHNCVHMYHKECVLKWMKTKHDFCPYCRSYVFPVSDFIKMAKEQVGEERFKTLVEEDDPELVAMYLGPNPNTSVTDETILSSPDDEEGLSA